MREQTGNMWTVANDNCLWLFTSNGVVKSNSCLVMGAGIAKQVRDQYPDIDKRLGRAVSAGRPGTYLYGLAFDPLTNVGAFQSKYHWRDPSSLEVINTSVCELLRWCSAHPGMQVHLNYPGIGLGGLTREQVTPLIEKLPDCVTIWSYR